MLSRFSLFILVICGTSLSAQNDLDAIRYARSGVGGSSRYVAMGGAFGALGADLSCAATNPGGLGLFTRGEINFGGGLKFTHNQGSIYGRTTTISDAKFAFDNFGISHAWKSQNDRESRHVIAFTVNQLQNFSNKTRLSGYTNNSSIAKDMLNIAQGSGTPINPDNLNYGYEGAAYNVYVLDTLDGKYFSFVDTKRTVLQTRDIVTSGKMNEMNFSYAYSYKDKFYIGASLGVPKISYTSTTTHREADDKDSMKVVAVPSGTDVTYYSTYIDNLPQFYPDKMGFNSLTYTEYFTTSGNGFNLKLGAVARLSDHVRVGMYYHTPTIFVLHDTYYNTMESTFDKDPTNKISVRYPQDGGYFNYNLVTPSRLGVSTGFTIKKIAAIGIDYELVNYKKAQLSSDNVSDFAGVNAVIENKYTYGHNFRFGTEVNLKPVMVRAGYVMQGSPFGNAFTGNFVRHTISVGFGFRTKNDIYYDFSWFKNFSSENYYMFTTIPQQSTINYNNSMLAATVGIKF